MGKSSPVMPSSPDPMLLDRRVLKDHSGVDYRPLWQQLSFSERHPVIVGTLSGVVLVALFYLIAGPG